MVPGMAKKSKATEADLWKLIAEHFAGQDLDLDEIADKIYTNAKGEVHIALEREAPDAKEESEAEAETEEVEEPEAEPTPISLTSDHSNVLDLLKGRTMQPKAEAVDKPIEQMNTQEFDSYYKELIGGN